VGQVDVQKVSKQSEHVGGVSQCSANIVQWISLAGLFTVGISSLILLHCAEKVHHTRFQYKQWYKTWKQKMIHTKNRKISPTLTPNVVG
jgi:hypothetical protein